MCIMYHNIKYHEGTTIKDMKDSLSTSARKCLKVPDYAQFNDKLTSMVNYIPLLEDVVDALKPSHICEIGSYKGLMTMYLVEKTKVLGAELSVVDPIIDEANFYNDKKHVTPHSKISVDYLKDAKKAEIYFIDGDHNYETISTELELIDNMLDGDDVVCLFMHDTGWPLAYRDLYYNPDDLKHTHKLIDECYLSPFEDGIAKKGPYYASGFYVAEEECTPKNGVRPAIEDFITKSKYRWHHASIPSIWGLSVLWRDNGLNNKQKKALEDLCKLFNNISSFLAIVELNRLQLLEIIQFQSDLWTEQHQYISNLKKKWQEQQGTIEELEKNSLDKQAEIKSLSAELEKSGRLWQEQQGTIEELQDNLHLCKEEMDNWRKTFAFRVYSRLSKKQNT